MVGVDREGIAAGLPSFVVADALVARSVHTMDDASARHIRVLRLEVGALVALRDGQGAIAEAQIVRLSKAQTQVEVRAVHHREPLHPIHLLVPVADRDRMLLLAEKACELGCTSWRPVLWRRSRSVAPRGEGATFQAKVRSRMQQALAQSEGCWLPELYPEANVERAILASPSGHRFVLDPAGPPLVGSHGLLHDASDSAIVLAVGPEGGIEADELAAFEAAGFRRASIGTTILRFETAAIAALAMARTVAGHSDLRGS
ncbi:MAG: RsmE family RNA methyltransferase [Gemmatimonadaceae bacterium]|nr:RsmE family RNA methyltransferase [Gemmatimonadaceae bacterium]